MCPEAKGLLRLQRKTSKIGLELRRVRARLSLVAFTVRGISVRRCRGFDLGEGHPDGDLPVVAGDLA
jgi:hypothetical protein